MTEAPTLFDLSRFLTAQSATIEEALAELRAGRKTSHWMWFVFPQISGLGASPMAETYAIRSLDEARAYLDHPLLGARLIECVRLVIDSGKPIEQIFGYPDCLKFRSSVTLFAAAAGPQKQLFQEAIARCCAGVKDPLTLEILHHQPEAPPAPISRP